MGFHCLIVEDDAAERAFLEDLVQKVPLIELVISCTDVSEASSLLASRKFDLLISDIELGEMSGIDFVKSLIDPPSIIFTTSFPNYAWEGFEVNAVDYILKPVTLPRLMKAVNKAHEAVKNKTSQAAEKKDHFFIRTDAQYVKCNYDDVVYIEAFGDFVKIYGSNNHTLALVNLKNIEDQLPSDTFMRVHRSYLVNINKIDSIDATHIQARSYSIPVSKAYRDKLHASVVEAKLVKRFNDN